MNNLIVYNTESGDNRDFEIPESEAIKILDARRILVKALEFEVIYDQIIESYWDYRNKINYYNLRFLSSAVSDYMQNHEVRSSLNRLAFNFFNLSKLYLDWNYNQGKSRCFSFDLTKDEAAKQKIEKQLNEIYKSNLHYVIGCKLRAYSQHRALPVKSFNTGLRYDRDNSKHTARFRIYYNYDDLVRIKVPKDKIPEKTKLDLTDIVDGFIFGVSQIHMLNRELTESVVNESRGDILFVCESYAEQEGFKEYRCELERKEGEMLDLSLEWFSLYGHLKEKHICAINYSGITFEK